MKGIDLADVQCDLSADVIKDNVEEWIEISGNKTVSDSAVESWTHLKFIYMCGVVVRYPRRLSNISLIMELE